MEDRDKFRDRLRNVGVRDTEIDPEDPDKLYVYATEAGWGIPEDCYFGIDVRLIESIGMDSLNENHPLYRKYAHHLLIFKAL